MKKTVYIFLLTAHAIASGMNNNDNNQITSIYTKIKSIILGRLFLKCKHINSMRYYLPLDWPLQSIANYINTFKKVKRDLGNPNALDASILEQATLQKGVEKNSITLRPDQEEKINNILKTFPKKNITIEEELKTNNPYTFDQDNILFNTPQIQLPGGNHNETRSPIIFVESKLRILKSNDSDDSIKRYAFFVNEQDDVRRHIRLKISPCTKCEMLDSNGMLSCTTKINIDPALVILEHSAKLKTKDQF